MLDICNCRLPTLYVHLVTKAIVSENLVSPAVQLYYKINKAVIDDRLSLTMMTIMWRHKACFQHNAHLTS